MAQRMGAFVLTDSPAGRRTWRREWVRSFSPTHLWEGVHGALHLVTPEALHSVEGVGDQGSALLQRAQHSLPLLAEQLIAGVSRLRRVHHTVHHSLTGGGGGSEGAEVTDKLLAASQGDY